MRRVIVAIAVCTSIWFPSQVASQTTSARTGVLTISLQNMCERFISDAAIIVQRGRYRRRIKSKDNGVAEVEVPEGRYTVTVEKHAFKRYIVEDVNVEAGKEARVNLKMEAGYASDDPGPYSACPE